MATQFLTVKYKIHNPGHRSRQRLDEVLTTYTLALRDLLTYGREHLPLLQAQGKFQLRDTEGQVKSEKYTDKSIAALLPNPSSIDAEMASSVKEALVKDGASMLAGYLALDEGEKQEAGFPVVRDPHPEAYETALEEFCDLYLDNDIHTSKAVAEADEDEARARLLRQVRSRLMPLPFSRSRDFALLVDPNRNKFYIWMKLFPVDKTQPPVVIDRGNFINLATGEVFKGKSRNAILLPIQIGKRGWQREKFIDPLLKQNTNPATRQKIEALKADLLILKRRKNKADKEAIKTLKAEIAGLERVAIKTAKLVKEKDDYFIHIAFAFNTPTPYEAQAYLGVNRGIIHTVGYGVTDLEGRIIETGHSDDPFLVIKERAMRRVSDRQRRFAKVSKRDYKRQELDSIVHQVVNTVLEIARRHRAALVLEDWHLDNISPFYRSAYKKINGIIEYKARLAGVPLVKRKIWSAYASQVCIRCGDMLEREKGSRVTTCTGCGAEDHVDHVNGVNIARRVLYKKADWGGSKTQAGDWRAFHRSFANGADLRAESGLRSGGSDG